MRRRPLTGRSVQVHNPRKSVGAGLRRRPGRLAFRADDDPRRGVRRGRGRARAAARSAKDARSRSPAPAPRRPRRSRFARVGVDVREHADLDREPGEHDEAFLDVWTPEVAPRVARLRAAGAASAASATSCSNERAVPTIGVTGTAGKTTTAAFLVQLLRKAGVEVHASTTARAGNLWPTAELLAVPDAGVVVLELTSSHLCFTTHSPSIAVITCFWPDHLELHGSLERYRAAKEAIVARAVGGRRRRSRTRTTRARSRSPPSRPVGSSGSPRRAEVEEGAFLRGGSIVAARRWGGAGAAATGRLRRPAPAGAPRRASPRRSPAGSIPTRSRGAPRSAAPRGSSSGGSTTRSSSTTGWRRRRPRPPRRFAGVRTGPSCSSPAASSRAPASPSTRRPRSSDCSRRPARRPGGPLASSSSSGRRPDGSRRCSTHAGRRRATTSSTPSRSPGERLSGAEALLVSPMFPVSLEERERIAPALRALAR